MFTVRHIDTGYLRKVYAINGTSFLLWDNEIGWFYEDMKKYRPYEVTV